MASETSRELAPLVQRADEIQAHHPLMAYYCRMRAVELGMAAPPDARPRKLLANLVEKLERTKADAGVVDGGATDFESCKRFALSVYARADRGDRARPPHDVPTDAHVEAFSAAGTFLKALEHFGDAGEFFSAHAEDLATRRKYAEWRAWDLATAAKARRGASAVGENTGRLNDALNDATKTVFATKASAPSGISQRTTTETYEHTVSPPRVTALDAYPAFDAPSPSVPVPVPVPVPAAPLAHTLPSDDGAQKSRWRPDWGGGGPHAVGASVLYSTDAQDTSDKNTNANTSGFALARVVAVDRSVDPPAYVVAVDGKERSTEAARLAPPPDPREARASVSSPPLPGRAEKSGTRDEEIDDADIADATDIADVSAGDGASLAREVATRLRDTVTSTSDDARPSETSVDDLAATTMLAALHLDLDPAAANDAARSIQRAAFAEAHELAMRAAGALDPSSGDKNVAADCLRRALAALEAAE